MAQSKCPDPTTSGSEHSGARHLSIFSSPHSIVHSPGAPTRPLPVRNHSRSRHLHFSPAHNTQALWFLAPRPIHIWLGALGGQTMVFDHPTFRYFPPLQPLALSTLRPRRSVASLGWTSQHAHTGFSYHTTHRNSHSQIKKQTSEHFRKNKPGRDGKRSKNMRSKHEMKHS